MKKSIFTPVLIVVLLMATNVKAQMGIGTATPNAAAQLDVSSTTKGFLAPRMTKTERDAINTVTSASKGLLIYQTDNTPGFYYYDGTVWTALAGSSSSAGVDLTTDQSVGGKKTFTSNDGLLSTGTFGSGTASSLNAGTRMMWYPKKAAFRAGYVDGTQWDDVQIGDVSTAMGYATIASGMFSTANGSLTRASGSSSTAMGSSTTASGMSSTAMGSSTTASGGSSTAMGNSTTASSTFSTAMGSLTIASGGSSTAMGSSTTASGMFSTAIGSFTTASGSSSSAMGSSTTASGEISTAIGLSTTAKSFAETAIGMYNTGYTPTSTISFNSADRLLVIGNGTSSSALSDALVMLKNGNTTFSGTVTATVVAPTSDIRLKRNIIPLKNSIEALMQLNPVSYEKKNSLTSFDYNIKENGFIAQELQKVMPTLVVEGSDKDKLLSVNYTAIIPVLTKAIQEQQNAIQEQKKENLMQQKVIQDQQANIKSLEKTAEEQQKQIVELKKMVEQLLKK
jgi:hypothetical protein